MHRLSKYLNFMSKRILSPPATPAPAQAGKKRRFKKFKPKPIDPTSVEGVLRNDVGDMLDKLGIDKDGAKNDMDAFFNRDRSLPWPLHKTVDLEIEALSSTGVGLGVHDGKAVVVPYAIPGDKVRTKIYRTEESYLESEILEILTPSKDRNDDLSSCRYFGRCSGCQYQMTKYEYQLDAKRQVVVDAFRHYAPELFKSGKLPEISKTVGSPLQYGYRTKLTPHFDEPRKTKQGLVPIGFGMKGRKDILDIEECAIGTPVVNDGMKRERALVLENIASYKRGATILLRQDQKEDGTLVCTTDNKAIITENVDGFVFKYPAGTFFQNNNSILPLVTSFVRENIKVRGEAPKFLVDTYCGSGLFAVTCSSAVERVIGVEISKESVEYATTNAKLNNIANAEFITGQAERIFEHVSQEPENTAVILDPPRKGCDKLFLDQLIAFKPAKVVYVSCNVHSQARDLEYLMQNSSYKIESLGGFDFFPQTYHVEGVAVLSL
ncbi:tRNA (uracil(54)-C(5))-methyltransferase [Wickerhamiella sorbophila]|uniref:tRNA (Uracil(54)-C(5))-methyltransferase n=1 Tax=Wickerhamiella sorbophila TaxID=45607 RepID=A0A2T0FH86_9ASCO|nr:tRNA (uracil(54)-C(5))-methyltransferase [Wickerhamiella sorbophila]PRT54362.1 tRNA (uracil(54)-C(5))-methyltransferase [Wickerhamiella sorbophila]